MLRDLVLKNRTYRRFEQPFAMIDDQLKWLVDLARLAPTAGNKQPLKYILASDERMCQVIFPCLHWAGYLTGWPGPVEGERPSAYIIILGDTEIAKSFGCDYGIAAQTIMLGATEMELGGCIIASIDHDRLRKELGIPSRFEILLALALGKPKEKVVLEHMTLEDNIKYWRDPSQVHHVPKRSLESIVLRLE